MIPPLVDSHLSADGYHLCSWRSSSLVRADGPVPAELQAVMPKVSALPESGGVYRPLAEQSMLNQRIPVDSCQR